MRYFQPDGYSFVTFGTSNFSPVTVDSARALSQPVLADSLIRFQTTNSW